MTFTLSHVRTNATVSIDHTGTLSDLVNLPNRYVASVTAAGEITVQHGGGALDVVARAVLPEVLGHLPGTLGLQSVQIGGHGEDTMLGGAGADVFVIAPNGALDRIEGFEIGVDRLDLSQMGHFYTVESVHMGPRWNGIVINFGDEQLRILTDDGEHLTRDDFDITDLRDLWHMDVAPQVVPLLELVGGTGADTPLGGAGDDMILGGRQDVEFDAATAQVMRLYQATLGRDPDATGLLSWTSQILSGEVSARDTAGRFVDSPEFQDRYGATDTGDFVTLLYANVLGRAPDAGGLTNWSARLDGGHMSRAEVVLGFANSAEFTNLTQPEALMLSREGLAMGWCDDVFRLYQATLGRTPDLGGLINWSQQLADGRAYESVISGFVSSAEFQTRYGTTTSGDFVTLLYANVLGRAPDAGGFASWTARLDVDGWTDARVVAGFAQSAEFRAATDDALTAWMRGTGADDVLRGGAGNDLMFGGTLSDTFVFAEADAGRKTIVGLERWDLLDFTDLGIALPQVLHDQFRQVGDDLHLTDDALTVILHDTALADLHLDMLLV